MHAKSFQQRSDGIPALDCHLHGPAADGAIFQWAPMLRNYRDYLDFLAASDVSGGIQNSMTAVMAKREHQLAAGNRHALKLARDSVTHPLRILPACIVHPAFLNQARQDLARFRAAGSCWAGEMCPYLAGYTARHPRFKALLRLLATENFIFQIHTQTDKIHRMIAQTFPDLTLVISHLGGKTDIEQKLTLAVACPNVFLDISGNGYERLGMLEKAVALGLENRILYGSDFPINDPGAVRTRILNGRFTLEVKRKILGLNLQRLLTAKGVRFF